MGGSIFVVEGVMGVHSGAMDVVCAFPFERIDGSIVFSILVDRGSFAFPLLVGYGFDRFMGRSVANFGITVSDIRKDG